MSIILTVTNEDQVILDKDTLRRLGVRVGDQLRIETCPTVPNRPGRSIASLVGMLKDETTPSLTIEEINEEAAAGWAGER